MLRKYSVLLFFILIATSLAFAEESITFTTYYPSPYGSYGELRLVGKATPPSCDGTKVGTMYYDSSTTPGQMKVCTFLGGSLYQWQTMGSSSLSSFKATRNNAQIMAADNEQWLPANEMFDTDNNYDAANSRYIVPAAGKYQFTATVLLISTGVTGTYGVSLYKNGGFYSATYQYFPAIIVQSGITVTDIIDCNAGDRITVYVFARTGVNIQPGSGLSFFSGHKL